jgi:putative phosphoribosyl transferase
MSILMKDRTWAGQQLAQLLLKYRKRQGVLVLALPRGGVPVGVEIARVLHAPLDILVVRKLGAPEHEELAIGAITSGGVRVLNHDAIACLGITQAVIEQVAAREQAEIERRLHAYRAKRPWPVVAGQHVILVDDGVVTGATIHAAVAALHDQEVDGITVAVPVAAFESLTQLRREVDEIACLATPDPFGTVGTWYESFPQLCDDDVRSLLSARWAEEDAAPGIQVPPGQKRHGAPQL